MRVWVGILLLTITWACANEQVPVAAHEPGIWQVYLHHHDSIQWKKKKAIEMTFVQPNGKVALDHVSGKAKFRGGMTSRYPKHSFTIDLKENLEIPPYPANDDWMLIASYNDKSFLRHRLGYHYFSLFDERNVAPQSVPCEVFLDTTYNGFYLLTEKMGATRLGIEKKDSGGFIFKDPPIFRAYADSFDNGQSHKNRYHQTYPKLKKGNYNEEMAALHRFIATAPYEAFNNPTTGIAARFDLDNLADWFILIKLTNNGDGILKNFYLYRKSATGKLLICPWDYDHAFGRDGDNEMNTDGKADPMRNILFKRLLEDSTSRFKERLQERYTTLKANGIFSMAHFQEFVQQDTAFAQSHLQRNFSRWPVNADHYYDAYDYPQEIEYMTNWYEKHLKYLDEYMKSL